MDIPVQVLAKLQGINAIQLVARIKREHERTAQRDAVERERDAAIERARMWYAVLPKR